jgi:hypothetical protein
MIELTRYNRYKKSYLAYYQTHKTKILAQNRQWNEDHRERRAEINRNNLDHHRESERKWAQNHPERVKAESLLRNLEKYPLRSECEFCGSTRNLEHGHVDYDYPELYLTVCHGCNCYMETETQ